jgi:hypothetical protein
VKPLASLALALLWLTTVQQPASAQDPDAHHRSNAPAIQGNGATRSSLDPVWEITDVAPGSTVTKPTLTKRTIDWFNRASGSPSVPADAVRSLRTDPYRIWEFSHEPMRTTNNRDVWSLTDVEGTDSTFHFCTWRADELSNMGSDQNSWELQAMWSRNPRVIINAQEKCSLSVMNQDVGCTRGTLILGIKRYWIQLGTMTLSEAIAHFNSRPASAPPTPPYSGRGSRASLWSHIPADIKCGDRPPHFVGRSPAPRRSPTYSQLPITIAPPQAAMEVRCNSIATGAEDGGTVTLYDSGETCDQARQGLLAQYRNGKDLCHYGIAATGQPAVYPDRRYGKYRFLYTADCPVP